MQYYNNIHNCPLEVFKKIQLDNDYKHLLIKGDYSESEAKKAWLEIIDEYQEAVKSGKNNTLLELQKQYHIKQNEYMIIKSCIFIIGQKLQVNLMNELLPIDSNFEKLDIETDVKNLNEFGYKVDINNIDEDLIRVEKQSKNKITQIKIAQKKIEDQATDSKDWSILDTIFLAQKHQGYVFPKDAKVIDLVVCLNDQIRQNKREKANLKKKNNGK